MDIDGSGNIVTGGKSDEDALVGSGVTRAIVVVYDSSATPTWGLSIGDDNTLI